MAGNAPASGSNKAGGAASGVVAAAAPLVVLALLLVVLVGGGAGAQPLPAGCGSGGTAAGLGAVTLTAEQMANAEVITRTTAGRHLPAQAAIVAVAASWTEARLVNDLVQHDHDSIGLFQIRVGLHGADVAADPVRATGWFLDALVHVPNWQALALTDAAADVERPAQAYRGRYAAAQPLATGVVDLLWPAAAQAASAPPPPPAGSPAPAGTTSPDPTALCPGGAGPIPVAGAGPGSTTVPAGLQILGSPAAAVAVRYALAQLGKPYRWGAAGPDSFDCSGLTMAAWAAAGIALPHWTGAQVTAGTPSPVDLSAAVAGDLVFLAGSDGTPTVPGHVGMVAGLLDQSDGRHLLIAQAPHTGVPVQLVDAGSWADQITAVRHIA